MLLTKEEIISRSIVLGRLKDIEEGCGVYFLIHNNDIVYVGQSSNTNKRIAAHKCARQIIFSSYYFIVENDKYNRLRIEDDYADFFDPIHNLSHKHKRLREQIKENIRIVNNKDLI